MGYRNLKSLSVLISLVLRHKPEAAGISLDEHGWADIETLMAGMNAPVTGLTGKCWRRS